MLIKEHQTLVTHIGKGLSQADKGRSRSTQSHLNPILDAPSLLPDGPLSYFFEYSSFDGLARITKVGDLS